MRFRCINYTSFLPINLLDEDAARWKEKREKKTDGHAERVNFAIASTEWRERVFIRSRASAIPRACRDRSLDETYVAVAAPGRDLTCKNMIRPARSLAFVAVWRRKAGRSNWDCNIASVVDMES